MALDFCLQPQASLSSQNNIFLFWLETVIKFRFLYVQGEDRPEPHDLWGEPFVTASAWKPCAHQSNWVGTGDGNLLKKSPLLH